MSDALALQLPRLAVYPEARREKESAVDRFGIAAVGALVTRATHLRRRRLARIIDAVDTHADEIGELRDDALKARFADLGQRLRRSRRFEVEAVGRCFAIIREAAGRTVGMRHHDVQLMGGYAMLNGMIAEMQTGEGKSLTATLSAATACLAGLPTHVVTVNDYLAQRDAEEFAPLYEFLGLRAGLVVQEQEPEERRAGYGCDLTYCTNKVLAFDYLRDQITLERQASPLQLRLEQIYGARSRASKLLLRGLHFAIVDEADSVLVDEARTPLLISQEVPSQFSAGDLEQALAAARTLQPDEDCAILTDERRVQLTAHGEEQLRIAAEGWGGRWCVPAWRQELVGKALTADALFQRDEQYLVKDGKVQIIDEYTGRVMPDRFWSEALHQLVELKEGCELSASRDTLARISYQRFFRRYRLLSGMTGTGAEVASELWRVYRLRVAKIPTHLPSQRRDEGESVVATLEEKWNHIAERAGEHLQAGRPVLIGTRTVSASMEASRHLEAAALPHTVLNADQDAEEAEIISQAGEAGRITIATNMAGRGADISAPDDVNDRGGLHVILSERHDAARIDRQLAGRTGRHGAPGSCETILSLEDPILDMDTAQWPRRAVEELGPRLPDALRAWTWRWILRRAQRRAEKLHARMRRQVLRADDQLDDLLAFSGNPE